LTRDRQHWLPKTYLRPFRAGDNDTIYSLELFEEPVWRHVGFNDIGNTRGYHSDRRIDTQVDQGIVNGYGRIIQKILPIRETASLSDILSASEIDELLLFARVHLFRNPLFVYRQIQNILRRWVILHPLPRLPQGIPPELADDIRLLRKVNKQTAHLTSRFQKEAFILARVQQMLDEDSREVARGRIIPQFENWMLDAVSDPEPVVEQLWLVYSSQPLFTVDNPFALSKSSSGDVAMTLPMSPHHLLVRSSELPQPIDPVRALSILPSVSFSTRVLSAEPFDFTLIRLQPLPHVIDPANRDKDPDPSQFIEVVYENIPVVEKHFPG